MKDHKISRNHFLCKIFVFLAMFLMMAEGAGCSREEEVGIPIHMSYINFQGTKIIEKTAYLQTENMQEQLKEVLILLASPPQGLEYQVPFAQGISVLTTNVTNGVLVLNLSQEYKMLDSVMEILTRASLVKSLTQIEGIDKVKIHIEGEPLKDSLNKVINAMSADMFIDNAGEELSRYEMVTVRLYFANEKGDGLVAVDRTKVYNTNISLDKFVVEELLKGPEATTEGVYPTINPNTKLISTLVKDKTCYVNLDKNFLTQVYQVNTDVVIYSIVNSLCEISGIDRVQIVIDGNTDVMFHGTLPLSMVFSRDIGYIQK